MSTSHFKFLACFAQLLTLVKSQLCLKCDLTLSDPVRPRQIPSSLSKYLKYHWYNVFLSLVGGSPAESTFVNVTGWSKYLLNPSWMMSSFYSWILSRPPVGDIQLVEIRVPVQVILTQANASKFEPKFSYQMGCLVGDSSVLARRRP